MLEVEVLQASLSADASMEGDLSCSERLVLDKLQEVLSQEILALPKEVPSPAISALRTSPAVAEATVQAVP